MCRKTHSSNEHEQMIRFNRYLVFYGPEEEKSGLKGISADAPDEIIDEFVSWYREHHRYENGRLRSEPLVRKTIIINKETL